MIDNFFGSDLIGVPFKKNGRDKKALDCYGVIIELAKRLGYFLPEQDTPESIKMRLKMFESISSEYAAPISKPESFSVVVFQGVGINGLHIGMVLEDCRRFIHIGGLNPLKRSVRIDYLNSWPWKHGIFFRLVRKCQN